MTTYYHTISRPTDATTFSMLVAAGSAHLTFDFVWDTVNEEQYSVVYRALKARAESDPLLYSDKTIDREYNWIDWYTSLPLDIATALEEGMEYPQSIKDLSNEDKAAILESRREEAYELKDMIAQYVTQLVWNVAVTDTNGVTHTGTVTPGGWINSLGLDWRVRFVSSLTRIGKEDLGKLYIEFEVA